VGTKTSSLCRFRMKFTHLIMILNVELLRNLQMEVSTSMNMSITESPVIIQARTYGCKEKNMKLPESWGKVVGLSALIV
jgi:hypothetical protein